MDNSQIHSTLIKPSNAEITQRAVRITKVLNQHMQDGCEHCKKLLKEALAQHNGAALEIVKSSD